jgi:fatty-acyl-CoA synthase
LPYTGVLVASLAGGELSTLGAGEVGNILISGPNVFGGYLQEADNRGVWYTDKSGQRWFDTGDCGTLDQESCLFITGRAKDLIIRGGHNIDPQIIEEPLRGHKAVAEVVAVGMPDARAGELPVVFVQLRAGVDANAEELLAFAALHIRERAAVPKQLFFVEQMPLTAVGKIFKPELRRRALESAVRELLNQSGLAAQAEAELDSGRLQLIVRTEMDTAAQLEALLGQLPVQLTITHAETL